MAFSQIDPARLQGEALRRWYLRSPADIEEERRSAAAKRYDAFFAGGHPAAVQDESQVAQSPIADPGAIRWTGEPNGRWGGERLPQYDAATRGFAALHQTTANGAPDQVPSHETPGSCVGCHGHLPPPPMPPPFGPFPWPIGPFPSFRDSSGGPRARPDRPDRDRKQCEMQEQSDRGICSQQPTERAKAVCYGQVVKRRNHCNATREIGEPDLFTAYRNDGRRWP